MCGIMSAIAQHDITAILLDGLKCLEYRGYDSAGMVVLDSDHMFQHQRIAGKVSELKALTKKNRMPGNIGIAHTRWATHGKPTENNAHPLVSHDNIAIVHNGIIENHEVLRAQLSASGYQFTSETDTEVVAHLIHSYLKVGGNLIHAVQQTIKKLEGSYALAILSASEPEKIIAVRQGSPLVIGIGEGENFVASDTIALSALTQRFVYLQDGDIAEISLESVDIVDKNGNIVVREEQHMVINHDVVDKGAFRHFMLKEIFEQPRALLATLEGRVGQERINEAIFGIRSTEFFSKVKRVQIVACGTSFHAGLVAHYWLESIAGIACQVDIASEYRYRSTVVEPGTLFVCISQSGETADTLAALHKAKKLGYLTCLAISNVPESSIVRESELVFLTRAGTEIGVASTKAFTTQLVGLLMLTLVLGQYHKLSADDEKKLVAQLHQIVDLSKQLLTLDKTIEKLAQTFADKHHALYLGRGVHYPIALEGALKLKELSYIHAEAYPAGELKHGPLALVDQDMPVVAVAPNDELLSKLKSNLQEVKARGGQLFVFADESLELSSSDNITIINLPKADILIAPIVYTIPLQLLSYHVAVLKGTDVDQPRNLAKSVTVE